jgi:hypothetical protein
MTYLFTAACFLLALIQLPPALALISPGLLTRLYGVAPDSPFFLLLWQSFKRVIVS